MMNSKTPAIGILVGYVFLHPAIMASAFLMSGDSKSATGSLFAGLATEISSAFSISMLPWSLSFALLGGLVGFCYGKIKQADKEKSTLIAQLQASLAEVDSLNGLLPICASCKKIRDDKGYWKQIEIYIKERSNAEFTHGICPDCAEKVYPGYKEKMARRN